LGYDILYRGIIKERVLYRFGKNDNIICGFVKREQGNRSSFAPSRQLPLLFALALLITKIKMMFGTSSISAVDRFPENG
jgi:hypothetical protein